MLLLNTQTGKYPNVHQQRMHTQWPIHTLKYSSTIRTTTTKIKQLLHATCGWISNITHRERRHRRGYTVWFHSGENLEKAKLNSRDRKQSGGFCGWVGEVLTGKSHEGIFWGDGHSLKVEYNDYFSGVCIQTHQTSLKCMHITIYKLHLQ